MKKRVSVLVENNPSFKERMNIRGNHSKFDLYTDAELGIKCPEVTGKLKASVREELKGVVL